LNRTRRKQATQWNEKVWILKLRRGETAEKVKMCQSKEGTDQDKGGLRPSPEKAHSSLVQYRIFEIFDLNPTRREQGTQWNKKVLILKLKRGETAEKVKMCQSKEGTDQGQGGLRPSPEKAHRSLVRYRIFEIFDLNPTRREQGTQWKEKVWILKLRLGETAEKVKMCQI
jgi:predicted enzyme related to lactoylglutathione lyase